MAFLKERIPRITQAARVLLIVSESVTFSWGLINLKEIIITFALLELQITYERA